MNKTNTHTCNSLKFWFTSHKYILTVNISYMISELQKKTVVKNKSKNTFHLLKGSRALIRCSILNQGRYCWSNTLPDFCWSSFLEWLWLLVFMYLFFLLWISISCSQFYVFGVWFLFSALCSERNSVELSKLHSHNGQGLTSCTMCLLPWGSVLHQVCSLKTPVTILCFYSQRPLLKCRLSYNHTEQLTLTKLCKAAVDHSWCRHCQDLTCTPVITEESATFAHTSV